MPKVSVLMPVYNVEKYIGEAIESILNQTYKDFEFLIIDDGSTDRSCDIINSYNDDRITLILNKVNIGLANTLNKGIGLAKGELIARMDPDDISYPYRLEKQVAYMDKNTAIGVSGGFLKILGKSSELQFPTDPHLLKIRMLEYNMLGHPSVIFRKELFLKYNLQYDTHMYAEDYDLWERCTKFFPVSNISEVLVEYRQHPEQRTAKKDLVLEDMQKVQLRLFSELGMRENEVDLRLHHSVSNDEELKTMEDVGRAGMWIRKLIEQNNLTGTFHKEKFENYFSTKWAAICLKKSDKLSTPFLFWKHCTNRFSITSIRRFLSLLQIALKFNLRIFPTTLVRALFTGFIFSLYRKASNRKGRLRRLYYQWLGGAKINIENNQITLKQNTKIDFPDPNGRLELGSKFIMDASASIDCNGYIKIGKGSSMGIGAKILGHKKCTTLIGDHFQFEDYSAILEYQEGAEIKIGSCVTFRRFCNVLLYSGSLAIGDHVFFNNYCSINCLGEIEIGANTMFGEGVKLYDHNHKYKDHHNLIREQGMTIGSIKIGSNCWIGSNTIILNNVTIGDNTVIGANNLIYKSIPANSVVKAKTEVIDKSNIMLPGNQEEELEIGKRFFVQ